MNVAHECCEEGNHPDGREDDGSKCPAHSICYSRFCTSGGGGSPTVIPVYSNTGNTSGGTGGRSSSGPAGEITTETVSPAQKIANEIGKSLLQIEGALPWLFDFDNRAEVDAINTYLAENGCYSDAGSSDDVEDFAELAVEAFLSGVNIDDVDFEDKIINKLTNPCAKNIFVELENGLYKDHPIKPEVQILQDDITTLNFSETILKLFNDSRNTDLIIQNGDVNNANANTVRANITISDTYLSSATQLSIARTIIHESVHAYLNAYFYGYLDFQNKTIKDKLHEFAKDKGFTNINTFHHEFMGGYVDAIGYSLYEWDKQYGTGGNLGWDYYRGMGFGGLFQVDTSGKIVSETDTFKTLVPNPADRQIIANIIVNEQKNNSDAKGAKCN